MVAATAEIMRRRTPPGPRGNILLGSALEFRRDFIQGLMDGWRRYGDVVHFRVARLHLCLVAHPDQVKYVLQENNRNYPKTPFVDDAWRGEVGEGLICSSGDFWLRQRRLAQPIFHRQRIAAFGKMMTDTTAAMLEEWTAPAAANRVVDMRVQMQRLTLDILARALFGADWSRDAEEMGRAVTVELEHLYDQLETPIQLPESLPLPSNRRLMRARHTLDGIVYRLIAERRRSQGDRVDLVSMLMQARDEETGEGMSDKQIHDEVKTMIFGGHETVSTGLTWVWYLLSKHPTVARRLRAELAAVLAGRAPTVDDLPRLTYTTMVIEEAMRLYPPVWLISRTPIRDDEIGGYRIPDGTMVLVCPYVTHRHPEFWENPEGFDPERFSPERVAGRPRFAYFPFAGGPRKCIGDSFGMLEMQLVVAMAAQRFRPDLAPGHPVVPQPGITMRARYGMLMTLEALAQEDLVGTRR
jgi:cytochrome P450